MQKCQEDITGRGGSNKLLVENPCDRSEDAGKGAHLYQEIRKQFRTAYDLIYKYAPLSFSLLTLVICDE